jgi:hypothetical protein
MLVAGLFAICIALMADTKVDYSHSTDFGKFRTYSWIKVQAQDQLWQDRLRRGECFVGGFDGTATTTVLDTPEGTLLVDIFDSQTKHLVWRGIATDTLSGDPEKNVKKLQHAVEDRFKHFPPQPKG